MDIMFVAFDLAIGLEDEHVFGWDIMGAAYDEGL